MAMLLPILAGALRALVTRSAVGAFAVSAVVFGGLLSGVAKVRRRLDLSLGEIRPP